MNAYELPKGQPIPTWSMSVDEVKALIKTNRQQADRITELEKEIGIQAWLSQTKPLSDEEILKEWTWKYTTCYEDNLLKFARAIEERHGIK